MADILSQNVFHKRKENYNLDSNNILEVRHLTKYYGKMKAVDDISFTVRKESLFAFLGLNGAGKSTTINIITSILSKDDGKIFVDGLDLDKDSDTIKNEIGIVFQNSVLDSVLSPKENLTLRAGFYGIKGKVWEERLKVLTDMLSLQDFINRPVGKLSGGQRRRVDIARAMVHNPKLLILDEPTTGLDPQTRLSVWALINRLREKTGMTVFLTTHYMEEAEKATYVVIMNKGKVIATGTPTELKNEYSSDYILIYQKQDEATNNLLSKEVRKYSYNTDGHYYKVNVSSGTDASTFISNHQELLKDFEVVKGNMDDVFLNATGVNKLMETNENEKA